MNDICWGAICRVLFRWRVTTLRVWHLWPEYTWCSSAIWILRWDGFIQTWGVHLQFTCLIIIGIETWWLMIINGNFAVFWVFSHHFQTFFRTNSAGRRSQGLAVDLSVLRQAMEKEFGKVAYCKKPPTTGAWFSLKKPSSFYSHSLCISNHISLVICNLVSFIMHY